MKTKKWDRDETRRLKSILVDWFNNNQGIENARTRDELVKMTYPTLSVKLLNQQDSAEARELYRVLWFRIYYVIKKEVNGNAIVVIGEHVARGYGYFSVKHYPEGANYKRRRYKLSYAIQSSADKVEENSAIIDPAGIEPYQRKMSGMYEPDNASRNSAGGV